MKQDKGASDKPDRATHEQSQQAVSAVPVGIPSAGFQSCNAYDLFKAICEFRGYLPGWWFTVGECSVSADASCGPDRTGRDAFLLLNRAFDNGFHADLPQPASMADALRDVTAQAIEARRAETGTGSVHESAVAESDAPDPLPKEPPHAN